MVKKIAVMMFAVCSFFMCGNAFAGNWETPEVFVSGKAYTAFHAVDIDGDGEIELLAGNWQGELQIMHYNKTTRTWEIKETIPIGSGDCPHAIATGDFDGDGRIDIVLGRRYAGLQVYFNRGNGNWPMVTLDGYEGLNVEVADFDRDGNLDILHSPGGWVNATARVYYGDGKGNFTMSGPPPAPGSGGGWLTTADINHDGFPDIAGSLSISGTSYLQVYLNPGASRNWSASIVGTEYPDYVASRGSTGDLNSDGYVDFAAMSYGRDAGGDFYTACVYWGGKDGQGNYVWQKQEICKLYGPIENVEIADLNQDGHLDVYFASMTDSHGLHIYYGDGKGNFSPPEILVPQYSPWAMCVEGDFNQDGKKDIIFGNISGNYGGNSYGWGAILSEGLRLWNRLGSDYEVAHSEVGPGGFWQGTPAYEAGEFGNAVRRIRADQNFPYFENAMGQANVFTVEFWAKTPGSMPDPNGSIEDNYNLFTLSNPSDETSFMAAIGTRVAQMNFGISDNTWYTNGHHYIVLYRWSDCAWGANEWHHFAFVIDNAAGPANRVKFYFDGAQQSISQVCDDNPWTKDMPMKLSVGIRDMAEYGLDMAVDNIKMYSYAKTDFSDRFQEGRCVLWNKLGSDAEVTTSENGPHGVISGTADYAPAQFGSGATNADANSYLGFNNLCFDGEKGAIEFWFKTDFAVVNGCSQDYGPAKWWLVQDSYAKDGKSQFYVFFDDAGHQGRLHIWMCGDQFVAINGPDLSWGADELHHFAIVYDRKGFDNGKTIAIYLDGVERASTASDWGGYAEGGFLPLWLANRAADPQYGGWQLSHTIFDNIKIWDYAKTDFSDRFSEGYSQPVKNQPPAAEDITTNVDEDNAVNITLHGEDPENDPLTYIIVTQPAHGTLSALNGSTITYTPAKDYNGSDTFTYRVNDGRQNSNTAIASITINPVNDSPIASDVSAEMNENVTIQIPLKATSNPRMSLRPQNPIR